MDDAQQRYDGGDDVGPSVADRQEIILRPMRPVPGPLQSPPLAWEEGKGLFNQLYRRATRRGNKIAG